MKLLESETVDLSKIDVANVEENVKNADKIANTIWITVKQFIADEGIKIIVAVIILIVGLKLISVITKGVKKSIYFNKLDKSMQTFLSSVLKISLDILLVVIVLTTLGVPMTSITAVIASAGVAIALAIQNSLSNIASGLILATSKPFVVGDWIKTGEVEGKVTEINILFTKIVTAQNTVVSIPNSVVASNRVDDYTSKGTRRIDISIGASYDNDVNEVKDTLINICTGNDKIMNEPAPDAVVSSYDDSSVTYTLMVWVKSENYLQVKNQIMNEIKEEFNNKGISIPYPQMDVHVKKD